MLDVPLLYESRTDEKCDIVIVMTAPRFIQKQRVMARSGMTEERFCSILMNQLSDQEKRKRADYVVQTGGCIHNTHTALKQFTQSKRRVHSGIACAQEAFAFFFGPRGVAVGRVK